MAQEKIEVRYGPTSLGRNAAPWYHKYIHYTDRDGNEFYARGRLGDSVVIGTDYGKYEEGTKDLYVSLPLTRWVFGWKRTVNSAAFRYGW